MVTSSICLVLRARKLLQRGTFRPCVSPDTDIGDGWAQEVEMVVVLVYELGEGAPDDAFKPSGSLAQLASGVASCLGHLQKPMNLAL